MYGEDRVCSIGTFGKLKLKASMQKLFSGKVDAKTLNYMSSLIDNPEGGWTELFRSSNNKPQLKAFVKKYPDLVSDLRHIMNLASTESVHACALVILPKQDHRNIFRWIPVKMNEKSGMLISMWEGEYLEKIGLLKEDILGVKMLDKFRKMIDMSDGAMTNEEFYDIPLDDERVYQLFKLGFSEGTFHFGSEGLTAYTKELSPDNIEDLIDAISLYRPGAMDVGAHIKYIKIKEGRAEPSYDFGMKEITEPTKGLLIYQEQVMRACQKLGGFSLVESDTIRRSMGKKKLSLLLPYKERFIDNMVNTLGSSQEEADKIWNNLEAFARYGFNRCISGDESIHRDGLNLTGKSQFRPNIRQMYQIKNDSVYAKSIGKYPLHRRYRSKGYGHGYSMVGDRLVRNKIVDIRYEGIKPVFKIRLSDGREWVGTGNHKFPTPNGETIVDNLNVGDCLYVNIGYKNDYSYGDFGGVDNSPKKGQQGFQKVSDDTAYKEFSRQKANKSWVCKECGAEGDTQIHHIDGDIKNGSEDNFIELCVSCHRKEHYKMGTHTKAGRKGLHVDTSRIESIEQFGEIDVYDVEMESPNHTFTTGEGIVTCNSHAAAYAITGYISQWFKVNLTVPFWAATIDMANATQKVSAEMKVSRYIKEIREINKLGILDKVTIMPPDINRSSNVTTIDLNTNTIYWSLEKVKKVGVATARVIIEERDKNGQYFSFDHILSRVPRKTLKKNMLERLILSGSFDTFSDTTITEPHQRKHLVEEFFDEIKKPHPEYLNSPDSWWEYQQFILCGVGSVNYSKLIANNVKGVITPRCRHLHEDDIQKDDSVGSRHAVAGTVISVDTHKTKKGDQFANIRLDINNETLWVTLWSDTFSKYYDNITTSKGGIMVVSGMITEDNKFRNCNVLQSDERSVVKVLDWRL